MIRPQRVAHALNRGKPERNTMEAINLSILVVVILVAVFDFTNGFHAAADMVANRHRFASHDACRGHGHRQRLHIYRSIHHAHGPIVAVAGFDLSP